MFFGVWEREKKCVENLGSKQISEKCEFSLFVGCLGLFIALGAFFEVMALGLERPQNEWILTPSEISLLPISKKVWILKIQRSD